MNENRENYHMQNYPSRYKSVFCAARLPFFFTFVTITLGFFLAVTGTSSAFLLGDVVATGGAEVVFVILGFGGGYLIRLILG